MTTMEQGKEMEERVAAMVRATAARHLTWVRTVSVDGFVGMRKFWDFYVDFMAGSSGYRVFFEVKDDSNARLDYGSDNIALEYVSEAGGMVENREKSKSGVIEKTVVEWTGLSTTRADLWVNVAMEMDKTTQTAFFTPAPELRDKVLYPLESRPTMADGWRTMMFYPPRQDTRGAYWLTTRDNSNKGGGGKNLLSQNILVDVSRMVRSGPGRELWSEVGLSEGELSGFQRTVDWTRWGRRADVSKPWVAQLVRASGS